LRIARSRRILIQRTDRPGEDPMDGEQIETFQASLKRCLGSPAFIKDFYDRFQASSDEVRAKFRDTDFVRQNRVLADSLYVMALAVQGGPDNIARQDMKRLARRHTDMGVAGWMFDSWLDCVLQTARAHDPEFSADVERAWRATLGPGIAYMRDGTPFPA
jgi:hemoglobin-like flavoprotein